MYHYMVIQDSNMIAYYSEVTLYLSEHVCRIILNISGRQLHVMHHNAFCCHLYVILDIVQGIEPQCF